MTAMFVASDHNNNEWGPGRIPQEAQMLTLHKPQSHGAIEPRRHRATEPRRHRATERHGAPTP